MPFSNFDSVMTKKVVDIVSTGGISTFGGAAFYLYKVYKGERFRFSVFLINLFLAFFIGYVVGRFFPGNLDTNLRDGIIAVSGFLTFPILEFIEAKGFLAILKKAGLEALGVEPTVKTPVPPAPLVPDVPVVTPAVTVVTEPLAPISPAPSDLSSKK